MLLRRSWCIALLILSACCIIEMYQLYQTAPESTGLTEFLLPLLLVILPQCLANVPLLRHPDVLRKVDRFVFYPWVSVLLVVEVIMVGLAGRLVVIGTSISVSELFRFQMALLQSASLVLGAPVVLTLIFVQASLRQLRQQKHRH